MKIDENQRKSMKKIEAEAPQETTMAAEGGRWPGRLHRAWAQAGALLPAGAPAGSNSCKTAH